VYPDAKCQSINRTKRCAQTHENSGVGWGGKGGGRCQVKEACTSWCLVLVFDPPRCASESVCRLAAALFAAAVPCRAWACRRVGATLARLLKTKEATEVSVSTHAACFPWPSPSLPPTCPPRPSPHTHTPPSTFCDALSAREWRFGHACTRLEGVAPAHIGGWRKKGRGVHRQGDRGRVGGSSTHSHEPTRQTKGRAEKTHRAPCKGLTTL
jgi:hypothetical protein